MIFIRCPEDSLLYYGIELGLVWYFAFSIAEYGRAGRAGFVTAGDLIEDSSSYCLQKTWK